MRTKCCGLLLAAVALVLFAATGLRADVPVYGTVGLDWLQVQAPSVNVTLYSSDPDRAITGANTFDTTAGRYLHAVQNGDGAGYVDTVLTLVSSYPSDAGYDSTGADHPGPYVYQAGLFCIDLGDYVEPSSLGLFTSYDVVRVSDAPASARSELSGANGSEGFPMGQVRADWLDLLADKYWNEAYLASADSRAAFQLAVWEIVFEGADAGALPAHWDVTGSSSTVGTVGAGDFYLVGNTVVRDAANALLQDVTLQVTGFTTGDVAGVNSAGLHTLANENETWLGALSNNDWTGQYPRSQDMLFLSSTEVPEPSGLALAGLGLVGLLSRRRKRA